MSWLNFLKKDVATPPAVPVKVDYLDIPLLPLSAVLFPAGVLALKVFEQRYLDMAANCMKNGTPFGVCLIASGKEVGETATPHKVGTLAHIVTGDMQQLGILMLNVRGGRRFRIISQAIQSDGLLRAHVELLVDPDRLEVPLAQQALLPLLQKVVGDLGSERIPEPHSFDDAAWVGYRLTEIVPVQPLAKQKLLELNDPVSRLEILFTYLSQRKLLV